MTTRLALCLALGSALAAQNYYVQPKSYDGVEGNSSTGIPFSYASARVQQGDGERIGAPAIVATALAFRRDRSGTAGVARTLDITILMGETNLSTFSATFASNWLAAPSTVYPRTSTNLPDISATPPTLPAPFAVNIPLTTPFPIAGTNAFLWELQVDANTVTSTYSLDWVSAATTTAGPTSTLLGTGCTTPNGTMGLTTTFNATVSTLNLGFTTTAAPSNAQVLLLLGTTNPSLNVPSLCTLLYTDAAIQTVLGTSSATGALALTTIPVPWQDVFANATLYSQVVSLDPSQSGLPVALSNGRQSQTPPTAGGLAPTNFRRTYSTTSSSATAGITPTTSAVVARVTY